MKKIFFSLGMILAFAPNASQAQSLARSAWKAFLGGNISDTLTLYFSSDSLKVFASGGNMVSSTGVQYSGDTVTINEMTGDYSCDGKGSYLYQIAGDTLHFSLVSDDCEGRTVITSAGWARTVDKWSMAFIRISRELSLYRKERVNLGM
jgi:hypothetical protein